MIVQLPKVPTLVGNPSLSIPIDSPAHSTFLEQLNLLAHEPDVHIKVAPLTAIIGISKNNNLLYHL
jgi:hypothetical protein